MTERDEYEEYDPDYDNDCWNCGGEGYVYGCSWEWQCDTWDGDSCLCTRRCEWCHPPKPDPTLQQVLGDALRDSGSGPSGRRREPAPGVAPQSGLSASEGIAQTTPQTTPEAP